MLSFIQQPSTLEGSAGTVQQRSPSACFRSGQKAWRQSLGLRGYLHDRGYRAVSLDTGMEVEQVADAVVYALSQPAGVAVDLLELRPNIPTPRLFARMYCVLQPL